jgi:hypothetical protein
VLGSRRAWRGRQRAAEVRRHDDTRERGAEGGSNAVQGVGQRPTFTNDEEEHAKKGRQSMPRPYGKQTGQDDRDSGEPLHVALAGEALLEGWTRERVIEALIGRVRRDEGYLAYRRACGRRTSYDEQVQADMRALALTACWLEQGIPAVPSPTERPLTKGR